MPLKDILKRQCSWADDNKMIRKGHCCESIDANLFVPLSPATKAEFAAGSGGELGSGKRTPKLSSLRSSAALAVNVFDPWRGQDLAPLCRVLGLSSAHREFHFEQKLPHGLGTNPPNLDLVFFPLQGLPVGIESKFCELYDVGVDENRLPLKAKYFKKHPGRWKTLRLTHCQTLAARLGTKPHFRRLDAGQLLKHILGLGTVFGCEEPIHLVYLWYDAQCDAASEHRRELEQFEEEIGDDIKFVAMTYQDLFRQLERQPEPRPGYLNYLRSRYFAA